MTDIEEMKHRVEMGAEAARWLLRYRLNKWVADAKGYGLLDGDNNIRNEVGALLDALDRISKGK